MSFIPVVVSEVSAILHIVTSIMTKIASLGCKFQKNISILNWLYLQVACSQCITPLQPRTLDIKWSIGREVLLTRGLYNLLLPSPQLTWTLTSAFRTKINFLCLFCSRKLSASARWTELSTKMNFYEKFYELKMTSVTVSRCRGQLHPGTPRVPPRALIGGERDTWLWLVQEPDTLSDTDSGVLGRVCCVITDWELW